MNGAVDGYIFTAPGSGGGPNAKIFKASDQTTVDSFFAYSSDFRGGVQIGGTINPSFQATYSGTFSGSITQQGTPPKSVTVRDLPAYGVLARINLAVRNATNGGFNFSGTVTFQPGGGIANSFSGSYPVAGSLATISGPLILQAGPFLFAGTFGSGQLSGTWSLDATNNGSTYTGTGPFQISGAATIKLNVRPDPNDSGNYPSLALYIQSHLGQPGSAALVLANDGAPGSSLTYSVSPPGYSPNSGTISVGNRVTIQVSAGTGNYVVPGVYNGGSITISTNATNVPAAAFINIKVVVSGDAWAGTYVGSYTGLAYPNVGGPIEIYGAVSFSESDGVITVINPGSGSGALDLSSGVISGFVARGVPAVFGADVKFTGVFPNNFVKPTGANGKWSAISSFGTASGTWTVMRQ